MSNAPSSVELNVPEKQASNLSQSMKHLSSNSSPLSSPDLSIATKKPSSITTVGRQLPYASNLIIPPKGGGFLSANNNLTVRRHSSTYVGGSEAQGRPRRSLPSPGVPTNSSAGSGSGSGSGGRTSWQHQKRYAGDEDYSEGYKSREDSPVQQSLQVGVNSGSTGNITIMSSLTRIQPYSRRQSRQSHQLRPHTATSATSLSHPRHKDNQESSLTPTLVFSLSSEDSVSGSGGG